ncbi:MAG: metalloregulator ArsR/SmtB family transcription factor [Leucobacter sp.]
MHALDVLGDPVRRRILELIADGEEPAGAIAGIIADEFGISQPAVSQHLRVLRKSGFATVRAEGARRLYAVDPRGLREAGEWLSPFERFWRGPLAALGTELARGKRQRRLAAEAGSPAAPADPAPAPLPGTGARPADPAHPKSEE